MVDKTFLFSFYFIWKDPFVFETILTLVVHWGNYDLDRHAKRTLCQRGECQHMPEQG